MHHVLEFNQSRWLQVHVQFKAPKRIEEQKNGAKDEKAFHKLTSNAVYGKTIENLRHRIDVSLVSNEKNYLKMDIKTKLYVTKSIWQ